jgi:hypothetical protein
MTLTAPNTTAVPEEALRMVATSFQSYRGHYIRSVIAIILGAVIALSSLFTIWRDGNATPAWVVWALLGGLAFAGLGGTLAFRGILVQYVCQKVQIIRGEDEVNDLTEKVAAAEFFARLVTQATSVEPLLREEAKKLLRHLTPS